MTWQQFERTKLAGYTVQKSDLGGWYFEDPAGQEPSEDFNTEEEAWEAADNHRMFGGAKDGPDHT